MSKIVRLTFCLVLHFFVAGGQNLVQNGSFEIITCCPTSGNELWDTSNCVPDWFSPNNSSPDYFNQCSAVLGVPDHIVGFQYARTGNAYCGALLYIGGDNREYIECDLQYPLVAGRKYAVEFYVNLKNNCLYTVDAVGAYFSTDTLLNDTNSIFFPVIPQVENPLGNNIDDTLSWVRIYGEFIALGGEQYITIGNFRSDLNTDIDTTSWGVDTRAYYYIEDVAVWDYDSANGVVPIPRPIISVNNILSHNDYFVATNLPQSTALNIYDSRGRIIYRSENYQNELAASQLARGTYLYEFILPDKSRNIGRLIVQ